MGQTWASPQAIQPTLAAHKEFLDEEVKKQITDKKGPHLRQLKKFWMKQNQQPESQAIYYECDPDFKVLKSLQKLRQEIPLNEHYQDIFTQLIQGLYELHSNQLIGRSFQYDTITYNIQTRELIYFNFGFFHSVEQLQLPPECLYKLVNTYESDYWLVAKIMWQLENNNKYLFGQDMKMLGREILNYQLVDKTIDNQNKDKLIESVNEMLKIYCGERITIVELLDNACLNLNSQKREEIKNFYKTYEFGPYIWDIMKKTHKRDNLENQICEDFAKEIFQILLTNIAIQLVFHYPTKDKNRYQFLFSTLTKFQTISSKILKDKLFLQEKWYTIKKQEDYKKNYNKNYKDDYQKLYDQINEFHIQADRFEKHVVKKWNDDFEMLRGLSDEDKIKNFHFKLYFYRIQASEPKSIPQKILLKLLMKLRITEEEDIMLNRKIQDRKVNQRAKDIKANGLEVDFLDYLKKLSVK